eukprot:scaffold358300_cov50-Prasinocladus_malaysianus.AAC.1
MVLYAQVLQGAAGEIRRLQEENSALRKGLTSAQREQGELRREITKRHVAMNWPCTTPERLARERLTPQEGKIHHPPDPLPGCPHMYFLTLPFISNDGWALYVLSYLSHQ